jgi:hypothetical protein
VLVGDYAFGSVQRFNPIHAFTDGDAEQVAAALGDEAVTRLAALDEEAFRSFNALLPPRAEREAFARLLRVTLVPARLVGLMLDGIERRVQAGRPGG